MTVGSEFEVVRATSTETLNKNATNMIHANKPISTNPTANWELIHTPLANRFLVRLVRRFYATSEFEW